MIMTSAQTKEMIKCAALELMRTTDPDRITAVEISKKAEISRTTFYRHYSTVDDVLCEIEDEFLSGIRQCCLEMPKAPLNSVDCTHPLPVYIAMTEYILAHREVYLIMTGTHENARFLAKWHRFIREYHADVLMQEGMFKYDAALFLELLEAGTDAIIRFWLEKHPDAAATEMAGMTERLLRGPWMD